MNLVFTPDQEKFRRSLRQFLDSRSPEAAVRAQMVTDTGYDGGVWFQMAQQLGLQGLIIPEEYGGSGADFMDLSVVLEEMGRSLLCAPFFASSVLATYAILFSEDGGVMAELLPSLATGETIATLAYTEPNGRWDADAIEMTASETLGAAGPGWTISGTKSFVLDGHVANLILVVARTGPDLSLFVVESDAPGISRTLLPTLDQTRKQATIAFSGTPARLVGSAGAGGAVLDRVLDVAAVALAVEQVGGAQKVLEAAVDYAKLRIQFGRPIGSFQAIKHKCANMLLAVETARSAAYYAASSVAEQDDELPATASLAKSYCSEAYLQAANDNIQIHGGIGFTWDHPAHLYLKRAKSSELLFGDPTYHRDRMATRIGI